VDKAILVNAEFLKLIVANPEIFGHDLDSPKDADEDESDCGAMHDHSHGLYLYEKEYDLHLTM
jgi:carnosine N-methyltransferase